MRPQEWAQQGNAGSHRCAAACRHPGCGLRIAASPGITRVAVGRLKHTLPEACGNNNTHDVDGGAGSTHRPPTLPLGRSCSSTPTPQPPSPSTWCTAEPTLVSGRVPTWTAPATCRTSPGGACRRLGMRLPAAWLWTAAAHGRCMHLAPPSTKAPIPCSLQLRLRRPHQRGGRLLPARHRRPVQVPCEERGGT